MRVQFPDKFRLVATAALLGLAGCVAVPPPPAIAGDGPLVLASYGDQTVKRCKKGDRLLPDGRCEHKGGPARAHQRGAPGPVAAPPPPPGAPLVAKPQPVSSNDPRVQKVITQHPFADVPPQAQWRCRFVDGAFVKVADNNPTSAGFCHD